MTKKKLMNFAIEEAKAAALRNEVPVGAILVKNNDIIARAGNQTRAFNDVTAHAEILVIRQAAQKLGQERLSELDLYTTLEPCAMCAAAISFARIRRVYIGGEDEKAGGVLNGIRFFDQPTCHHAPEVYSGFQDKICVQILKDFFLQKRSENLLKKGSYD